MVFEPKKYQWKDGFGYKVKASVVGEVVEKIEERDGNITKEAFLDESRPEESPTHSMFEWNDTIAAEKYRLEESRHIINALQIIYTDSKDNDVKIPAVINVTSTMPAKTAQYRNIVDALSEKESRDLIISRLQREVDQLIERNRHIEELADILKNALRKLEAV